MNILTSSFHALAKRLLAAGLSMMFLLLIASAPAVAKGGGEVIRSGKDVRMTFTGPASPDRGVATPGYQMRVTHANPIEVEDTVRIQVDIFGDEALVPGDVTVEFETTPGSGDYQILSTTSCWTDLCAELGDVEGFPIGADYDESTAWRFTFNRIGQFTVRLSVVGVHSHNFYASESLDQTVVAPDASLDLDGPASIDRGVEASGFASTLVNAGSGAIPESVMLQFEIASQQQVVEGTVTIDVETAPDAGVFVAVPLSNCGSNLCGTTGPDTIAALLPGASAVIGMHPKFDVVGSYQIQVRAIGVDSGTEYASASGAVEVVSAPATLIVIAGDGQTALVGEAVPIAPVVRVIDAGGAPVAGANVEFLVGLGGGSVSESSVISDSEGLASAATWTLGTTPGSNTLSIQVPGSYASAVTVDATAMEPAEIALAVATQVDSVTYGDTQEHVVVISNAGSVAAGPVSVSIPVPVGYAAGSAHWTCLAINEAVCPAAGDGGIEADLELPVGSSAIFVFSATVAEDAGDTIDFRAEASCSDDISPQDNLAISSTPVVLSRFGFEAGDSGAGHLAGNAVPLAVLDAGNDLVIDLDSVPFGPVMTVAKGATASGDRFALALVFAGQSRVALLSVSSPGQPASWSQVLLEPSAMQAGIGLVDGGDRPDADRLLVVGEGFELERPFDALQTIQVSGVPH
ncbi:hypothetical protein SAMN05216289_13725 [Dokdonella immobilis]|uniref:Big-1 domain-containing protein n=2 Tax=Dokdonella immobilis TaxID=578942 RepID=A0A1I5AG66_9GAMM|nr:hypothetical protein SAMN05216289_13725 [Dokdonella immobilis]